LILHIDKLLCLAEVTGLYILGTTIKAHNRKILYIFTLKLN
jgi:hypothetical protein